MPQRIDDIATYDKVRVGRNVTDLLWFYEEPTEAVATVRQFLFSVASNLARPLVGGQDYDSLEILWYVLNSFDRTAHAGTADTGNTAANDGPILNRFVVIGGYGWGKSSLALVAANFFGLPRNSPGYGAVVEALEPESNVAPRQLVDKRNAHKLKFTICIKGRNQDFHEMLIGAVAESKLLYSEILKSAGIDLAVRSEYEAASDWLKTMDGKGSLGRALADTAEHLPELLSLLSQFQKAGLERADRLWRAHNHVDQAVKPSWYFQTGTVQYLEELIEALTSSPDSPFDGVLVLFDELGLWLEYANEDQAKANVAALLAFMEAAPRFAGRLAVCSFIQSDIEAFVGKDGANSNVRHVSERLGARVHYKPDLELVFQSAIKDRSRGARLDLWKRHEPDFTKLADLLVRTFPRYRSGTWASVPGRVKEVLVKRCWPIHPFMVAAVCHLRFGQGGRVISILESEFQKLGGELGEDAHGSLRWSTPVDVVDFYRTNFENLHSADGERSLWTRYSAASQALRGRETKTAQGVLKAVFLCHALQRSIKADTPEDFPAIVASLAGIDQAEAIQTLSDLESSRDGHGAVLLSNEATGWYDFFGAAESPLEARSAVMKMYEKADGFSFFGEIQIAEPIFKQCTISPGIFAAQRNVFVHSFAKCFEAVVDLAKLSDTHLAAVALSEIRGKLDPDARGVHLVVLYSREKLPKGLEKGDGTLGERVEAHCQKVLDGAWRALKDRGEQVPLVLSVPKEPPEELYRSLGRWVSAGQLSHDDRKRLGEGLTAFRDAEFESATRHAQALRANRVTLLVPSPSPKDPELTSIKRTAANKNVTLSSFFEAVYGSRPPLNSESLGKDGTKYVRYVHSLMLFLLNPNRLLQMGTDEANVLNSVLMALPGLEGRSWCTVEQHGSKYEVIVPKDKAAAASFAELARLLDDTKAGKAISIRNAYSRLSRAPWALDARSFSLLFGVWYALNRERSVVRLKTNGGDEGRPVGWEEIGRQFEKSRTFQFLFETETLLVAVRDTAKELAQLREHLVRLEAWVGDETVGQTLLADTDRLRVLLPTAIEWTRINKESERVAKRLEAAKGVMEALDGVLAQEIEQHFSLENAKDGLRRLTAACDGREESPGVVSAGRKTFDLLIRKVGAAVGTVVAKKYGSADVECHELDRTRGLLRDLAAEVRGDEFWNAAGTAVFEAELQRVLAARNLADARRRLEADEATAVVNFNGALAEAAAMPANPTLGDLRRVSAAVELLRPGCPEGLRKEFDSRAQGYMRECQELERQATVCADGFSSKSATTSDVRSALATLGGLLARLGETPEAHALKEVASLRPVLEKAAGIVDHLRESQDEEELKQGVAELMGIGGQATGVSAKIVQRWTESVEGRRQQLLAAREKERAITAFRQLIADQLAKNTEPLQLATLRSINAALKNLQKECPREIQRELELSAQLIGRQVRDLEREYSKCITALESATAGPSQVIDALKVASELNGALQATEEGQKIRAWLNDRDLIIVTATGINELDNEQSVAGLEARVNDLRDSAKSITGPARIPVRRWSDAVSERVGARVREAAEADQIASCRRLIAEAIPQSDAPTLLALRNASFALESCLKECPKKVRGEVAGQLDSIKRQAQRLEAELQDCLKVFGDGEIGSSRLARARTSVKPLALRAAGTPEGEKLAEIADQDGLISQVFDLVQATTATSTFTARAQALVRVRDIEKLSRGPVAGLVGRWVELLSAQAERERSDSEAKALGLDEALDAAKNPGSVLQVADKIHQFVRLHRDVVPDTCNRLEERLATSIKSQAPLQIASILRAVPEKDREAVVTAAWSLVK